MPDFKLPLSGDVIQSINPWTAFMSAFGSQFGLININLGRSTNPEVEAQVLQEVASYGKQLGRVQEALAVLIKHFKPDAPLTPDEDKALEDLRRLLADIAEVKARAANQQVP